VVKALQVYLSAALGGGRGVSICDFETQRLDKRAKPRVQKFSSLTKRVTSFGIIIWQKGAVMQEEDPLKFAVGNRAQNSIVDLAASS